MLYYTRLKKEDLNKYAELARKELTAEEYFSPEILLMDWDEIESYILITDKEEWVGWCAISSKPNICNPEGKHFLCGVIFPEFRGKGFFKYLYKIYFDKTIGKSKLVSISPYQDRILSTSEKYGFTPHETNKIWNTYVCDKDTYPEEFKNLELTEIF